jgi:UDP-N-acetylmuramyl pentapeptide phosphotransferase/UDP-N-acetylglucosamine-1-phosphate transferase
MSLVFAALLALALSAAGVRVLASETLARGVLDVPNARSLHARCVPRTGGLGLLAAAGLAWAPSADRALFPLAAAAAALAALSFVDDIKGLPVRLRFASHAAAALFVVLAYHGMPALLVPLAVLTIMWTTNLFNFMDGADGLAGGMAAFGFAGYAMAAHGAGDGDLAGLAAVISGAAIGFLVWNFNPARIFLGDAGSIPLGFLAAGIGLVGRQRGDWPVWFPVLLFAPFLADATVTLLRRAWRGARLSQAHREHYYQRLILAGWGHRRTALAAYALMSVLLGLALTTRSADAAAAAVVLGLVAAIFGFGLRAIDRHVAAKTAPRLEGAHSS